MCGFREGGLDWVASNPPLEKQNGKKNYCGIIGKKYRRTFWTGTLLSFLLCAIATVPFLVPILK